MKIGWGAISEKLHKLPSAAIRYRMQQIDKALEDVTTANHEDLQAERNMAESILAKRSMNFSCDSADQLSELRDVWRTLKAAGYCSGHIVEDLKQLIHDSMRPATEELDGEEIVIFPAHVASAAGRLLADSEHRGSETEVRFNGIIKEQSV